MDTLSSKPEELLELALGGFDLESLSFSLRGANPESSTYRSEELATSILNNAPSTDVKLESLASLLHSLVEAAKAGVPELSISIRNEIRIDPKLVAFAISGIQDISGAAARLDQDWGKIGKMQVDLTCEVLEADLESPKYKDWELSRYGKRLTNLSDRVITFVVAPLILRENLQDFGRILSEELHSTDASPDQIRERNCAILSISRVLDELDKPAPYFPSVRFNVERLTEYFSARRDAGDLPYHEKDDCITTLAKIRKACVLVGFTFGTNVPLLARAKMIDRFYSLFNKTSPEAKWAIALYNDGHFTPLDE